MEPDRAKCASREPERVIRQEHGSNERHAEPDRAKCASREPERVMRQEHENEARTGDTSHPVDLVPLPRPGGQTPARATRR